MKKRKFTVAASSLALSIVLCVPTLSANALTVNITPMNSLQQACDQVNAAGGGTVNLSAGTYNLLSAPEIHSNITLTGAGAGKTILKGPSSGYTWPLIEAWGDNIHNITIQQMTLDGNIAKSWANRTDNPYVNQSGIHFFAPTAGASGNFNISNVEVHHCSVGMSAADINGLTVYNCACHDNGVWVRAGLWQHNLYFNACSYVTINQSQFYNSWMGAGIHLDSTTGYGSHWIVENCSNISGNAALGINIQNGIDYVTVKNNTIKNNGWGANVAGNPYSQDGLGFNCGIGGLITGNHCDGNKMYGIRAFSGNGSITNNEASGNGTNYWINSSFTVSGNH